MKYEKPELVALTQAVSGIQHPSQKASFGILESLNPTTYASVAAYEADE